MSKYIDEDGFIIDVMYKDNGLYICSTNDPDYNAANTDGYWMAVPEDIAEWVADGTWIPEGHKRVKVKYVAKWVKCMELEHELAVPEDASRLDIIAAADAYRENNELDGADYVENEHGGYWEHYDTEVI